jgi:hypothetical protein
MTNGDWGERDESLKDEEVGKEKRQRNEMSNVTVLWTTSISFLLTIPGRDGAPNSISFKDLSC